MKQAIDLLDQLSIVADGELGRTARSRDRRHPPRDRRLPASVDPQHRGHRLSRCPTPCPHPTPRERSCRSGARCSSPSPRDRCSMPRSPIAAGGRSPSSASPWCSSPLQGGAPAPGSWSGWSSAARFYLVHIQWATVFLGRESGSCAPCRGSRSACSWRCGARSARMLITLAYRWLPRVVARAARPPAARSRSSSPASGRRARRSRASGPTAASPGAGSRLAVGQPARAAVRLARRLGRQLRDGVPGRRWPSTAVRDRPSVPRAASRGGPRRGSRAAMPGRVPARLFPRADRRHAARRRRAGQRQGRLLRPAENVGDNLLGADRRHRAGRTTQDVDVVVWPEGAIRRRPAAGCRARRGCSTRCRAQADAPLVGGAITRTTATPVLQHLDALARGRGRRRLLRQEAPGAVRRVRARPRVLATVRARPDRPHRARVHAGHDRRRHRCRTEAVGACSPASPSASTSSTTS